MSQIGLISNPKSQQNRCGFSTIDGAAKSAGIEHRVLGDMTDLLPALKDLAADRIEVLAINGGDGTLQAVLTSLLEDRPFDKLPLLAVLPRGMTNMSAFDVGLKGKPGQALLRLADLWPSRGLTHSMVVRHVLRLENVPGFPTQRGMFFGVGSICRAIEYCHNKIHPWRIGADLASAMTLVGLLSSWLFRGRRSDVVTSETIDAVFDNEAESSGEVSLALATTLDRLVLGSQPFWNQQGEPVRYTAIAYPPNRLLRSVRQVLYGGNAPRLPAGYKSRSAHRVQLRFDGPFTLDGQMFEAPSDEALVITAPEAVEFLRL